MPPAPTATTGPLDALAALEARVAAVEGALGKALQILERLDTRAQAAEAAVEKATALVDEFRPVVEQFLSGRLGKVLQARLAASAAQIGPG